jgi:alanyl-tRNA synthetase
MTGKTYYADDRGFPFRVIADHARSCTFLVSDGVLPSNEGRGYVLRRILRRAARFAKVLGWDKPFLCEMVPVVVSLMKGAYPEIEEKQEYIEKVVRIEEERFHETLSEGMRVAEEIIERTKKEGSTQLNGEDAFLLYDTYGFPLDLAEDIAEEYGMTVDKNGFNAAMNEQRERARAARSDSKAFDEAVAMTSLLNGVPETEFLGYELLSTESKVLALIRANEKVSAVSESVSAYLILDKTPFYAESGGQVGDTGIIQGPAGNALVKDTQKLANGIYLHHIEVEKGILKVGDIVQARVDGEKRKATARNHTATHIIHRALRNIIGEHAQQAGSLVGPDRLRFDFSHFSGLSNDEIAQVEDMVNRVVLDALNVEAFETELDKAKTLGATALFGEKYGDKVRVVKIGDYSMELCGGTHCRSTGEIGLVKIVSEAGIGAGLRRIEAVTGHNTRELFKEQENLIAETAQALKTIPPEVVKKAHAVMLELKNKEKEIEALQGKLAKQATGDILDRVEKADGVNIVVAEVLASDMNALRSTADLIKDKLKSGVIVLGAVAQDKVNFVAMVTADLKDMGLHAGNILKETAKAAGGGGGGRPDMAQAGGKNPERLPQALETARKIIKEQILKNQS